MGEMVERVARALSIADGMHPDTESNDEDSTPAWTLYVGDAKAAIEAMRVPTKAMIDAADRLIGSGWDDQYDAVIDAALKE